MRSWLKSFLHGDAGEGQIVDILISDIVVPERSSPLNWGNVNRLAKSIREVGLLHPLYLTASAGVYRLLWGYHRLEACKMNGAESVPCIVVEGDPRILELAELEENLTRNELGPSEHARQCMRRDELFKDLAARPIEELSHSETQSERTKGSVRDHAERTGETKDKVARALKRGRSLGVEILKKTAGTSLDKDVELDALIKLSADETQRLLDRAAAGEKVSARTTDGKPKERMARSQMEPPAKALGGFCKWLEENPWVEADDLLSGPIAKIKIALSAGKTDRSHPA